MIFVGVYAPNQSQNKFIDIVIDKVTKEGVYFI